jgi:hypothetical protein
VSLYASELRRLRRESVRVNRRLALAHVEGVVAERDEEKWKVRLELATDEDGKKILSPWVKPHSNSSGVYKDSPSLPAVGDRMRLHSPSGIVGGASYAIPSAFDDEVKRPEGQTEDERVREYGKTRVSQTQEKLTNKTEKTTVEQTKETISQKTEKTTIEQKKDEVSIKGDKKFEAEADEASLKGKTSRIHGESIDKIKFIVGDQAFHIRPEALQPTSA